METTGTTRYETMKGRLMTSVNRRREQTADTVLTLAFLCGNQWCSCSMSRGLEPIQSDDITVTDNLMLPAWVRWLYYHVSGEPVLEISEGGHELGDAEKALVSTSLYNYWVESCGLLAARIMWMTWVGVSGAGFIAPVWHRRRRRMTTTKKEVLEKPITTASGKKTYLKDVPIEKWTGDIGFEVFSPMQVHTFPTTASKWEQVESVIIADLVPVEKISRMYGFSEAEIEQLPKLSAEEMNRSSLESINRYVSGDFPLMNEDLTEKRVLVMQYLERPTVANPNGKYELWIGDKLQQDESGDLPFAKEAAEIDPNDTQNLAMGLIPCFNMDFPMRLIPPSPMGELRRPQRRWNALLSDQEINRRQNRVNKLLYQEGTIDPAMWDNQHGQAIGIKPHAAWRPQWLQAPPLSGIEAEKATVKGSFDEASGQVDSVRGENPTQVRSADHFAMIQESAMTRVYYSNSKEEQAYQTLIRLTLAIAKRRYSTQMIEQILGRDFSGYALPFKEICIPTDIRIRKGSIRPKQTALVRAQLAELVQTKAIDARLYLDMLDHNTMNRGFNPDEANRRRARSENFMMLYGTVVMPEEHENHEIHIEEVQSFMTRPEYYMADVNTRALYKTHMQYHAKLAAKLAAPTLDPAAEPAIAGLPASGSTNPFSNPQLGVQP